MNIAEKVTRLRERKGWNMSDLARASDIPQPTIWRLEKGVISQPKASILQRLAQALEVSADYLLGKEENISFDELLRNDPVGQALFRSYEELNPQDREKVGSFVSWLRQEAKKTQSEQEQAKQEQP